MSDAQTPHPAQTLRDIENPAFVSFLDMARWLAATLVCVAHARNPLFLGYNAVPAADRNLAMQAWYFVTGWHAEAVVVFFVLSGFLVGGLSSARVSSGRFSISDYSVDRLTRLYTVYLPALILTVICDWTGAHWFSASGVYDHTQLLILEKVKTAPFGELLTVPIFFQNVFMLQTVWGPPLGSNQPLWTISLEFWFYVIFGLAVVALVAGSSAVRAAAALISVALLALLGWPFHQQFGLWLIGVLAAFIPWRVIEKPVLALVVFAVLLTAIRLQGDVIDAHQGGLLLKNYTVATAFAWVLISMRQVSWRRFIQLAPLNHFMADFSYSLYLIHFPLLIFILAALHGTGQFDQIATGYSPASAEGLAVYLGVLAAIFVSAWALSQVTERQTWRVRSALKSALKLRGWWIGPPSAGATRPA